MTNITEKKNYDYCQHTINFKNGIERNFLELGARLYNIREENLYQPAWETFEEYCMELKGMSYGTVSKLISVYKTYVLEHSFSPEKIIEKGGTWTVLYKGIPLARDKQAATRFLDDIEHLSSRHVEQSVREAKSGVTEETCKHPDEYTLKICPACGRKHRV